MLFAQLCGWREVQVTERRTTVNFADVVRDLVDEHFPTVEELALVLDSLNAQGAGSLYEAFTAAEARCLTEKLEIHFTPKHGR